MKLLLLVEAEEAVLKLVVAVVLVHTYSHQLLQLIQEHLML